MAPLDNEFLSDNHNIFRRTFDHVASLSPTPASISQLAARAVDHRVTPVPGRGNGTINPITVNNKGVLAIFGFLGAGLVCTSIWFFFWAKNGGFIFREGDWEDYKSTVLRRKDRHGKTLSNATKSTDLGQGDSVNGEYDQGEQIRNKYSHQRDNAVRDYRHEKPARVGGLNRKPDGSYYDHNSSDRSDVTPEPVRASQNQPKRFFSREKKAEPVKATRKASNAYSFNEGDDSTMADPAERPHRQPQRPRHDRHSRSPNKRYRDHTYANETPMAGAWTEDGDIGTKAYHHHIPGVSRGARTETTESSFERGEKRGKAGYRRGGGGHRRDSLSESDGETVLS